MSANNATITRIRPTQSASKIEQSKELLSTEVDSPPLSAGRVAILTLTRLESLEKPLRPGDRKGLHRWVVKELMNSYGCPTQGELDTAATAIGILTSDEHVKILRCKNGLSVQLTKLGIKRASQLRAAAKQAHPAGGSAEAKSDEEAAA